MTSRSLRVAIGLALLLALVASQDAGAGAPTDQLRSQIEKVLKTVEDPELKKAGKATERREAVRRIAAETFDFTEMSKRAESRPGIDG